MGTQSPEVPPLDAAAARQLSDDDADADAIGENDDDQHTEVCHAHFSQRQGELDEADGEGAERVQSTRSEEKNEVTSFTSRAVDQDGDNGVLPDRTEASRGYEIYHIHSFFAVRSHLTCTRPQLTYT